VSSHRTVITPRAGGESLHLSPRSLWRALMDHRQLIAQLARRQVDARFRGSYLGRLLALVNPLLLLGVFTLVFTELLPIGDPDDRFGFALRLFSGLLLYSVFADTVGRAPTLVVGNPNYVKKVVFPLEVLAVAELMASALLACGSLLILLLALLVTGRLTVTAFAFPLVVPPVLCTTLGVAWMVTSLGVYVRDIASSIGVLLTILLYLTPVFYGLDQLGDWRWLAELNPLAAAVDSGRRALVLGAEPDWRGLAIAWGAGAVVAYLGFVWFRLTKRGFADVL
jgi:lipopolysaccharide transport system permease protein